MQSYPKMLYLDDSTYKLVLDKEAEKAANDEGYVHHWELANKQEAARLKAMNDAEESAKKQKGKKIDTDLV